MNKLIENLLKVENDTEYLKKIFASISFSPEDNKLRLYPNFRFDKELWLYFKSCGLKYAPKQELFVFSHSISREDLCLFLLPEGEEIEAEGTTLAERAEIKAERLEGYYNNRVRDMNVYQRTASSYSERFAHGQPILVGHHSEKSARRDQKRADSAMNNSLDHARRADYWSYKINGVAHYANMKSDSGVRMRRIETLLKDLRDTQKTINSYKLSLRDFKNLLKMEDKELQKKFTVYKINDYSLSRKVENNEIETEIVIKNTIHYYESLLEKNYAGRLIVHILNRISYEQSLLPEAEKIPAETINNAVLKKCLVKHGCPSAPKQIKLKFDKKEDTISVILSGSELPLHVGEGTQITKSRNEWSEFMQEIGYRLPISKPKAKPLLNINVNGSMEFKRSYTDFNGNEVKHVCEFVHLTKEQYKNIRSEGRGTFSTLDGEARIRVCLDPNPNSKTPYYARAWVAVYITDSKTHPTPASVVIINNDVEKVA